MRLSKTLNLIKKGRLNSSQGFSLVELMVVVAIIGILAAIAIPNYQKFQARSKQTEARTQLSGIYASEKSFAAEWGYGSSNLQQIGYDVDGAVRYNCGWATAQGAGTPSAANVNLKTRAVNYRGPLAIEVDRINGFTLIEDGITSGSIAPTVNKYGSSGWDTSTPAAKNSDLPVPNGGASGFCSGTNAACTGPSSSSACTSAHTSCSWSAEGSFAVNNSNPGNVTFTIGCIGDIEGAIPDEWTMNDGKVLVNTKPGI